MAGWHEPTSKEPAKLSATCQSNARLRRMEALGGADIVQLWEWQGILSCVVCWLMMIRKMKCKNKWLTSRLIYRQL